MDELFVLTALFLHRNPGQNGSDQDERNCKGLSKLMFQIPFLFDHPFKLFRNLSLYLPLYFLHFIS